jgi:hypothetical protein
LVSAPMAFPMHSTWEWINKKKSHQILVCFEIFKYKVH